MRTKVTAIIRRLHLVVLRRFRPIRHARSLGVHVGDGCRLIKCSYSTEPYLIRLGNHVSATRVHFETHDGGVWVFRDSNPCIDIVAPITIGDNMFLGYEVIVMPGITIGDSVVVGARSVVTRDLPSNVVAVGTPARVIRNLDAYHASSMQKGEDTKLLSAADKRQFYERKYSQQSVD